MKPLRKHVAIAIDGGGIKGVMVARALAILEDYLGRGAPDIFHLAAGTSTGSIISAGIAVGLTGAEMHALYVQLGDTVFRRTLRSTLWLLGRYRYPAEPLVRALGKYLGALTMGDLGPPRRVLTSSLQPSTCWRIARSSSSPGKRSTLFGPSPKPCSPPARYRPTSRWWKGGTWMVA